MESAPQMPETDQCAGMAFYHLTRGNKTILNLERNFVLNAIFKIHSIEYFRKQYRHWKLETKLFQPISSARTYSHIILNFILLSIVNWNTVKILTLNLLISDVSYCHYY